ncbi:MAG: AAA family ATPase [Promicromonosporaceae bacterium]|nr:AAA family ATPase [Promicromonosporaceae bacterium]
MSLYAERPGQGLVGRRREQRALEELLADVHRGRSRALVLRGEAGLGKTALLDHLVRQAAPAQVLRVAGVETEMELTFAGLHQLCAPLLGFLDRAPVPQREALAVALGRRPGDPPDRFLVGLAVLTLLQEAAAARPVVCVVDDVQWLDDASQQTIGFVARRLPPELAAALVLSERTGSGGPVLPGMPELAVGPLPGHDARDLFDALFAGPVDDRVRERFLAEAEGNPLALVQLSLQLTPERLAGGFGLPGTGTVADRVEVQFAEGLATLEPAARTFLLVAAAEPSQDAPLVERAAATLGADPAGAVASGLVELDGSLRFRHPLARSAVYRAASSTERRAAHAALADAADDGADRERRAWHRAHAADGADEDVAAELERCAELAQGRGGVAAAAAFRDKAAALTPDPRLRVGRTLLAAEAKLRAGAPEHALRLLAAADAGPGEERDRAVSQLLRAQAAVAQGRGDDQLLPAARRLEAVDARLAWATYRDALDAALARSGSVAGVATAVLGAPVPEPRRAAEEDLLTGLALTVTGGFATGADTLRRGVLAFLRAGDTDAAWLPLATRAAVEIWDEEVWEALTTRTLALARRRGELRVLPDVLRSRTAINLHRGDLDDTEGVAEYAQMIAEVTGDPAPLPWSRAALAAFRGRREEFLAIVSSALGEADARAERQWHLATSWCSAVLHNGLGRYDEALEAAETAVQVPAMLGMASWAASELAEAASRAGDPLRAEAAVKRLEEIADAVGTDWAAGAAAQARALMSDGETAEAAYAEAVERLGRTRLAVPTARARLLYGEWLRRAGRRVDARVQLRAAHDAFAAAGMAAFAERTRRELQATGEVVRGRGADAEAEQLTEQELQIALLAVQGRTNTEIAGELFLSPRTVEWHLRKVFTKLGIARRTELRRALEAVPGVHLPG